MKHAKQKTNKQTNIKLNLKKSYLEEKLINYIPFG